MAQAMLFLMDWHGQLLMDRADIIWLTDGAGSLYFTVGGAGGTVQGTDGSFDIQPTDDGPSAANARGESSVDLQTDRNAVTQVASGARSFIGAGRRNTASSPDSVVVGGIDNITAGGRSFYRRW